MAISMTEAAAKHVQRSLEGRGKGEGIRLGVRTTGCSGLAYVLEFVDELAAEDLVFESHGVKVIIDPKSLVYLDGTELDFTREGLNEGFKFNNPNVRGECGCGESSTSEAGVGKPVISPSSTCNRLSWSISTSSASAIASWCAASIPTVSPTLPSASSVSPWNARRN